MPLAAVGIKLISRLFEMALLRDRGHGIRSLHSEAAAGGPKGTLRDLKRQVRASRLGRKIELQVPARKSLAAGGILQLHGAQQGENLALGVSLQAFAQELLGLMAGRFPCNAPFSHHGPFRH